MDDDLKKKIVDHISSPSGREALGRAMAAPIREALGLRRCGKCKMSLPGVMDRMLHTDEECCVYLVMES